LGNGKINWGLTDSHAYETCLTDEQKMLRTSQTIARLLPALFLGGAFLARAADQPTTPPQATHHKIHKKLQPLVLPPLPNGPLTPVPMDQLPATPPKVTYESGMLAISAQNATLGEILRDVRRLTGATIETPPGAGSERVVAQLGPGAPRDILALLFNGTPFNYVMLGSVSDPASVVSVVLSSKGSSSETQPVTVASTNTYQPPQPVMPSHFPPAQAFRQAPLAEMGPGQGMPGAAQNNNDSSDDPDSADDDSDQAQPNQPGAAQADSSTQSDQPNSGANSSPNSGPPPGPEQLLQKIQQFRQPGGGAPQPPQQ